MRTRSRVGLAVVVALCVHVVGREIIEATQVRVRPVAARSDVVIELDVDVARQVIAAEPPPVAAPVRAQPRAQEEPARERAEPDATAPAAPAASESPRHELIAESDPPSKPPSAPSDEIGPRLPQRAPSSFLERVIAGTTGLPPPNLDEVLRAPPAESEAEAARKKVQALASAAAARGAPPPADAGTAIDSLEKLDDGSYRYETGGFVATIHVDGHVTFVNKDNRGGAFSSGLPGRDPDNILEPYGPSIDPIVRVDHSKPAGEMGIPMGTPSTTLASGSFDPTAAMLRAQGQDPYEHEKLCFLDETLDLRAELRIEHEKRQMAGLRRSLERAWFDEEHTPIERRAAIFAIWDECREEEVGMLARAFVESFVRQHLPKGSPDAFSDDELAALNATRASVMEFRPYG